MIGKIIAFEGVDRVGKTTYINLVRERLAQLGVDCFIGQELPNKGTFKAIRSNNLMIQRLSELQSSDLNMGYKYRKMLIDPNLNDEQRLFVVSAARIWHTKHILIPAIENNICVLMDRYIESTYAYQGITVKKELIDFFSEHIWNSPNSNLNIFFVGKQYVKNTDDFLDQFSKDKKEQILNIYNSRTESSNWIRVMVNLDSDIENIIVSSILSII